MDGLTNFLEETISCLNQNGKAEEDVLWVGKGFGRYWFPGMPEECKSTWEDFKSKADFRYDRGFGLAYIPGDLVIVGKDFWLERAEYDGSEWWEFKTMPTEPVLTKKLELSDIYEDMFGG